VVEEACEDLLGLMADSLASERERDLLFRYIEAAGAGMPCLNTPGMLRAVLSGVVPHAEDEATLLAGGDGAHGLSFPALLTG
jgi:hypothetical protein